MYSYRYNYFNTGSNQKKFLCIVIHTAIAGYMHACNDISTSSLCCVFNYNILVHATVFMMSVHIKIKETGNLSYACLFPYDMKNPFFKISLLHDICNSNKNPWINCICSFLCKLTADIIVLFQEVSLKHHKNLIHIYIYVYIRTHWIYAFIKAINP